MLQYNIRKITHNDLPLFINLYRQYAKELLSINSTLTEEIVKRDGFGNKFEIAVAVTKDDKKIVGFVAWQNSYDLHWGISGGNILDLYVAEDHRCKAIAPLLTGFCAKKIRENNGQFLSGQGIVNETHPERLYAKIAVDIQGVDCILGGRAFKVFSELDITDIRSFIKGLPKKEWNYEEE
ncbi:MAG: GNAT family N-acetyltransferase [Spirochaetales bacterium]|nr:GNAT family N-acetyltransferase [Spirochaetales bacterium]